jgi:hypothetical protein
MILLYTFLIFQFGCAAPQNLNDFWKGENSLQLVKEKIKIITVKLGGKTTLIMKPVPQ